MRSKLTKNTLFRKSVFLSFILSYTAIAFIFIISLISSYSTSTSALKDEIRNKNVQLLSQIQTSMDSIINDMSNLANLIILNDNIMNFISYEHPSDGNTQYLISQISDELKNYRTLYGNTADIFVYSLKNDYILSSKVSNSTFDFHEMYFSNTSYSEWLDYITSDTVTYNSFNTSVSNAESSVIILSKPLVSIQLEHTMAYLAVVIDSDTFLKTFDKYSDSSIYSFLIIDSENRVLCRNKASASLSEYPSYEQLPENNNIYEKNGLFCIYSTSAVTNWRYLTAAPKNVVLRKIYNMIIFDIAVLIISILVFIVLCSYLLKKNYRPVSNIIGVIGENNLSGIENEYDYIEKTLTDTFSKNRKLHTQLEKQNLSLRNNFLQNLLKGSSVTATENFTNLGIDFNSDYYIVCIYYIDDCAELFFEENNDINDNIKYASIIISNVLSELMNENGVGYIVEAGGMLTGIYNSKTKNSNIDIEKINQTAQNFALNNFNLHFSVAQSSVINNLSNISIAYKEALDVLEYKIVMCNCNNLTIDDLQNNTRHEYGYTLKLEQQLIDSIKLGNIELANNTLEKIFEVSFEKSSPTLSLIQCLLFNIISTMIKAIEDISVMYKDEFVTNYVTVDNLLKCKTVSALKDELNKVLVSLCGFIQSKKQTNEDRIETLITKFVDENYAQSTLSVASIAEHFNMSMSYLSSTFKQITNTGLLEYINNVRIKKSIELLGNDKLKINDIANMVGYTVPRTYLNIFKKVTGLTPSQYRELKLHK